MHIACCNLHIAKESILRLTYEVLKMPVFKTGKSKRSHLAFWREQKLKPDRPSQKNRHFEINRFHFFPTMISMIWSNSSSV